MYIIIDTYYIRYIYIYINICIYIYILYEYLYLYLNIIYIYTHAITFIPKSYPNVPGFLCHQSMVAGR